MQPLSMAVLAALTPPEWEVTFYDDRMEPIDYEVTADLVGISIESYTAFRGYQIAKKFRSRSIPVILGGYHATLCPQEALGHADAICVGEAENVWRQILDDAFKGRLQEIYRSDSLDEQCWIKPKRAVFKGKRYFPLDLIETGRGCPFACDFCSISAFHHRTYHRRPVELVVQELKEARGLLTFFVDDNIGADREGLRKLCAAVEPLGKHWVSQAGVDIARDNELPALMARSGCTGLLIGFESLDRRRLSEMGKPTWHPEDYPPALARLRQAGIAIYGTFVFGYPDDAANAFKAAQSFARKEKFFLAAFNHLVPFPGTPLYARSVQSKQLNCEKWWLSRHFRFGQTPLWLSHLAPNSIEAECLRQRQSFYSLRSILSRATDLGANCNSWVHASIFVYANMLQRREINTRQGIPLGCADDWDSAADNRICHDTSVFPGR